MKWRPFRSGVPYTCQDCPAYAEMANDRDHWRKIASIILDEWVPKEAKDAYVDQLMSRDPKFAKVITGE